MTGEILIAFMIGADIAMLFYIIGAVVYLIWEHFND